MLFCQGALKFFFSENSQFIFTTNPLAAITIRVWYMFTHSSVIRALVVTAFLASTVATGILTGTLWEFLEKVVQNIQSDRTSVIAWFYVPSLFLHSFLFALKVYRFMMTPKYLRKDTLLWRFLKE
ncbi:hypothetical protein JVU11DRAFT_7984 [Chiua virens]|nr:hypothetical protein JVU11DRAFT_7984 [Chiua virens]